MTAAAPAPQPASDPAPVEIAPVDGRADLREFIRLPGRLAAGDPCWIEPLHLERREFLSQTHNPFFQHAETASFLARREGAPVGRITAVDDALAPPVDGRAQGFFGMLAAADEAVVAALIEAAADWLRARGRKLMRGPYSLSVNQTS
ncbi:MAG: dATP pyrophosphohydrolase, partial [Pseudomonadota bacterium]